MKTLKLVTLLISTLVFVKPNGAHAQAIGQIKKYYRCYSHLANTRVKANDPLLDRIRNGEITGQQACRSLIYSRALMTSDGELNNSAALGSKDIISNMQRVHTSWFSGKDLNVATTIHMWNQEIYDYNTVGLYFTRALFDPSYQFKNVVSDNNSYDVRRDVNSVGGSSTVNDRLEGTEFTISSSGVSVNPPWNHSESGFNSTIVGSRLEKGPFRGWKELRPNLVQLDPDNGFINGGFEYLQNRYGAGALSTPAYLIGNTEMYEKVDGGLHTYRRWSNRLVKDFLCRDLPVISSAQASSYVDMTSSLAFRKSSSCMNCHATQDNLSYLIRDFTQFAAGVKGGNQKPKQPYFHVGAKYMQEFNGENPVGVNTPENNFHKRPSRGRFVYVTSEGTFIDQPISSLDAFGDYLGDFQDFYSCFAGRYLEYFTGIKPFLGSTAGVSLNNKEVEHRNFAIQLGVRLKNTQDPRKVIEDIFASSYYNDLYYRSNGGQ